MQLELVLLQLELLVLRLQHLHQDLQVTLRDHHLQGLMLSHLEPILVEPLLPLVQARLVINLTGLMLEVLLASQDLVLQLVLV